MERRMYEKTFNFQEEVFTRAAKRGIRQSAKTEVLGGASQPSLDPKRREGSKPKNKERPIGRHLPSLRKIQIRRP